MPPEPDRPATPELAPDVAPPPGLPAALLDEFAGLGSLADRTGRARTSREVAASALETVRHTTGATAGLILFNASDRYEIAARFGLSKHLLELVRDTTSEDSPLAAALEATTEPILVPVDRVPFRREIQDAIRAEGINAVALVGLRIAGKVVGVLAVAWHAKLPGRVAESVLLPAAALVAVALQNALLVERLEETLASEQRLVEEQAALESLTQIGETAEAFDDLAERTLAQVTELLGARGAAYVLLQPGDNLRYVAWRGIPDEVERIARSRRASENQMVRALVAGGGAHVGTYTAEGISRETRELASREGWTAYGVIPIRVGKRLEGMIAVYFDRALTGLRVDERGLDLVGRIASISLANFRLRERLATSEESYRTLFDQSPEALVLLSADAEVITANRAALELYRTDVPGLVAYGAIGGPRIDAAEARRRADLLATPGQKTHRRTGSRPDGSTFPQEVIVTPLVAEGS